MSQTCSDKTSCTKSIQHKVHALKRCVECRTPVPINCSSGICDTCISIRLGEKVRCKCGNKHFQSYRPITIPQQSCIMCMVRGITSARTDKQKKLISEYEICSDGCDMPRKTNIPCRFCAALHYNSKTPIVVSNKPIVKVSSSKPIIDLSTLIQKESSDTYLTTEIRNGNTIPTTVSITQKKWMRIPKTFFTNDILKTLREPIGVPEGESFVIVYISPSDKRTISQIIHSIFPIKI